MPILAASWLIYLEAGATVLAALGTLSAVLVTLYLNVWRTDRQRPRLSVSLPPALTVSLTEGVSTKFYAVPRAEREVQAMTLDIKNSPGKRTARNVEVLVRTFRGDTGWPDLRDESLTWRAMGNPTRIDIPSGTSRRLVLLWVGHGEAVLERATDGRVAWEDLDDVMQGDYEDCLGIFAVPGAHTDKEVAWVAPERHRVQLIVTADDADAAEYELEFDGTAGWAEGDAYGGWEAEVEWITPPHRL